VFFAALNSEMYHHSISPPARARVALADCIEVFSNRMRLTPPSAPAPPPKL
jgi:hypothetical protein